MLRQRVSVLVVWTADSDSDFTGRLRSRSEYIHIFIAIVPGKTAPIVFT